MKINFTKSQYETLLKSVYLGNWVINSGAEESEGNQFDKLEEYLFSHAKDFGLEGYAAYDEEEKVYYPSPELEEDEELNEYLQNYDEDTFWARLIFNLARRDMEKELGTDAVEKMSDEECFAKERPFAEKYEKEFGENGLKNITIARPVKAV
jgi:hypothetical protein